MVEIEVETRKIGGSIGIIIPSDVVEKEHIKPHEKIKIDIRRAPTIGDLFGLAKDWKKPTEEIMREVRKGWKEHSF